MVLRHHNEAESLNAVQKMDWEWKVNEITGVSGEGVIKVRDYSNLDMKANLVRTAGGVK